MHATCRWVVLFGGRWPRMPVPETRVYGPRRAIRGTSGIERRRPEPSPAAGAAVGAFDLADGEGDGCGCGGGAAEGLGEGVDLVVVGAEWEDGGFFDQVLDPGWSAGAV